MGRAKHVKKRKSVTANRVKKDPAWKRFEKEVAQLYREIGAIKVTTDINMHGNQIDVYAEIPSPDGTFVRAIISCKHYASTAKVNDVREWNLVYQALRNVASVDIAIIVSAMGFTQNANTLATKLGIKPVPIEQLKLASSDFVPYLRGQLADFQEEPVFTENFYIPMRVTREGSSVAVGAREAFDKFLSVSKSALLILLGDYGAGKTTFCKHLFIELASAFLKQPRKALIPLYVNLREYPEHLNLQSLLTDLLVNKYGGRSRGYATVEEMLRQGKLVILFDAFDEMASRMDYQTTLQNF